MKKQVVKKLFDFSFIIVVSVFTLVFYNSCQKEINTSAQAQFALGLDRYSFTCIPPVPTGLFADSISTSTARLHVTPVAPILFKVIFNYKRVTDSTWLTTNPGNPSLIYSLTPGTVYEYYAVASCAKANAAPPKNSTIAYFTTFKNHSLGCNCRIRPIPPGCAAACGF